MENRTFTILLVDDSKANLSVLKSILEKLEFPFLKEIIDKSDPQEALEFALNNPVDLVISDYDMPHINGIDMCKLILKKKPSLKVIIVSGTFHIEDRVREIGFEFIAKPFSFSILQHNVKKLLNEV